ncbi:hybrid sensor histidine kinase/response regulator [Tabrizicola oligotrophica]|uniref:histidine kinase n=1 Tax=Tabrizicola oligotrophica TaxID=2710650 RepID=A0A6M0QNC5_9RHOB|nr:ATP-binding protein [Tabrizicola oligotrophica]NEY88889.1 response regulator [Tabrizicola oligotrophica]
MQAVVLLLLLSVAALAVAGLADGRAVQIGAALIGLTFVALVMIARGLDGLKGLEQRRLDRQLVLMTGQDATPSFTTDAQGQIRFQNDAARDRFGGVAGHTLVAVLQEAFAAPAAVLYRLQARAVHVGAAREDVVSRRGHTRLAVHRLSDNRFLWRLEEFADRTALGRGAETLSLPMLTANKAGVVLFTNEAMRRLLGGRPKHLDRVFTSPTLRSGEEVEVNGIDGPLRAILAEVEGMAERREIFLLPLPAQDSPAQVQADFEHVPVPLLKFAPDGGLRAANAAAREQLQLDEAASPAFHDLFDGLGRPVGDWLADVVAERKPGGAEVLTARQLGHETFVQVTLRRIVEGGRPGVLAILQDATALKTLEAQFVQSQKMQAIGQLAGGIAHDFNNLLTAISGHCDLLLLRHRAEDPAYADLIQIHQNANRAAALVGQLLAYSRKQTLKPERLELEDLLSDLTHLLNRLVGERITLRLSHGAGLQTVRADRRKLEQVVMNLVVNARDAMPDGGAIRIETEALTLRDDMRRDRALVPAGDYALIRVSDTGCGIPEDRLQKIFEPFYTTKKQGEGTGLGLSTAYGIVKQSGGFIFVDSTEGEGSIFQIYFPVFKGTGGEEPAELPAPRPSVVMRPGEGVVLLVEDEAPVRAFASRALRMRGYTVLEAESAEEALAKLEDPTLEVDIFVTDVVMPGMDGPSWVKQALEMRPNVRVIFVSGYAEDALSEMQARIPNSVFLPKPFSLSDLAATVQGQLLH